MKRIAVNTRLLVPEKMDGIGRFSYETLIRIAGQHPEIDFTFIFDRQTPTEFQFPKNVSTQSLFPPARIPLLWFWWFEISLRRFVNAGHYDLFLSPEGWIPGGLKCKSLGIIHDLNFEHHPENIKWTHRWYLKTFFPKYAKRATRLATVSEYSKADISSMYNIPTDQIDVLYNGANEIFQALPDKAKKEVREKYSSGEEFFLFVGTIHPRKNLKHLFLAFDEFCKSDSKVKLLIAGNRKWWPAELESILQNMEYKKQVLFLGRQSDEDLAQLMSSSLALTYLPYFEGFGIPIIEAFQAGTAVICSNLTSMPEVAQDAALLCDPNDIKAIAAAMKMINEDPALRQSLIDKGKQRAGFFSWEKSASLLFDSMKKTHSDA